MNWRCWLVGHKWGTRTPTDAHYCRQCSRCNCLVHGCTDCHRGRFDLPWCVLNGGDGRRPQQLSYAGRAFHIETIDGVPTGFDSKEKADAHKRERGMV